MKNPVAGLNDYYMRHLPAHLENRGRAGELHRLLALETGDLENAWYEAKKGRNELAGYRDDVARGLRLAGKGQGDAQQRYAACGTAHLEIRYTLMLASLNSMAGNMPVEGVLRLVQEGLWQAVDALKYVRQMPDASQRSQALARLLPHLPERRARKVARHALRTAWKVPDHAKRVEAVVSLIPLLPDRLKDLACRKALQAAKVISDEQDWARALIRLAPHLQAKGMRRVLRRVKDWPSEYGRCSALVGLAPWLTGLLLRDAWDLAVNLSFERYKADALIALTPNCPESVVKQVVQVVQGLRGPLIREKALGALVPLLARCMPRQELEALAAGIKDLTCRAKALAELACRDWGFGTSARQAARALRNPEERLAVLRLLLSASSDEARGGPLQDALSAAKGIGDRYRRVLALASLLPDVTAESRGGSSPWPGTSCATCLVMSSARTPWSGCSPMRRARCWSRPSQEGGAWGGRPSGRGCLPASRAKLRSPRIARSFKKRNCYRSTPTASACSPRSFPA